MAPSSNDAIMPKITNFKVHKMLGKGSYGKVYKVQRQGDEKFYALKETDLSALSHLERMDAVNEIRLLVSVNHPNVIRYNEAFLNGNKLCCVMEYAPFGDLRYYISKGQRLNAPFPEEAIWRIFLQLCKGLSNLHSNHIIHRDIKPANIFLCQNDLLKIGDLGVAKALTKMDFAKTQIGTPVYMAPEVWSGKLYSYSSDLWSLGCVLYEMMTFKVPIEGRTMQELKVKVSSGRYTPIASGRYSNELIGFCHSLLSLDPRRRPLPNDILSSSAAAKWLRVLPAPTPGSASESRPSSAAQAPVPGGAKMLNTIIVPRDIRQLNKVLPPPSYDVKLAPALTSQPSDAQQAKDQAAGSNPPSRPSSREQVALPGGGKPVIPRSHSAQMKPHAVPGLNPLYGYKGAPAVVPLPSIQGLRQVSDNALNGQRHPLPGRRISLS